MKKIFLLIIFISTYSFSATYYVDLEAEGNNTGTSWVNAFTNLQTAINTISTNDTLFVKAGTYYPSQLILTGDNRSRSFYINKDIKIYGGFNGTESTISERNIDLNVTTLSGDFNDNDTDTNGNGINDFGQGENAYTVVFAYNVNNTARIDGFRIFGGNADGDTDYTLSGIALKTSNAGGIYNINSSIKLKNIKFINNSASLGGAMFNKGTSLPKIENSEFIYNFASFGAATYTSSGSLVTITDTTFLLNRFSGGVVFNNGGGVAKITNCSFNNNSGLSGGAIYNLASSNAVLLNCRIFNNTVSNNGGAVYNSNFSTTTMYNTLIYNNSANYGGFVFTASNSYVNLINTTVFGNHAATKGGGFYCRISPDGMNAKITNSIVWGNTSPSNPNFFYEFFTRSNIHVKNSLLAGSGGSANWDTDFGLDENNNLDEDPLFTNVTQDNEDFTLQSTSNGIDASYNQFLTLPNGNNAWTVNDTDVYGNSRLNGSNVDIGAVENGTVAAIEDFNIVNNLFYYNDFKIITYNLSQVLGNKIVIFDVSGRKVFETLITNKITPIPKFNNGVYILKSKNNLSQKFVIN